MSVPLESAVSTRTTPVYTLENNEDILCDLCLGGRTHRMSTAKSHGVSQVFLQS